MVEFHAARLLLLISLCGTAGRIDGLTKMAKLDFFARYPDFFEVAAARLRTSSDDTVLHDPNSSSATESAMVRHHYGPWDKRYYHVLAHLESKSLITVAKEGKAYQLALTDLGKQHAKALVSAPSFSGLVDRMRTIKKVFGGKSGTFLKDHIYKVFDEEVGRRPMGQVIG
ncbi:MAG: hypothetical protein CMM61_05910 [Rhodospirillaceae bacterium]|nr:hypothetical protein [Rhodospirillaceae bacterium]